MFKVYIRIDSLVETCLVMPRVELLFGREHLYGKSVSDFRTVYDGNKLACQESQLKSS